MYKVFINQKAVFICEHIDPITIHAGNHLIKCKNCRQIKKELSQFLSNPSATQLFLYNNDDSDKLFSQFCSMFSFIEAAGGLVRDLQGRILFIHRLGLWDLPKGKTEPGEEAPAAALREVMEETGLQHLTILRPLAPTYHVFERKGTRYLKRTHWYEMQSADDGPLMPQMEEDITDVRWFSPQGLSDPLSHTYPAIAGLVQDYLTSSPPLR